jgi:hypothetical protein
MSTSTKLNSVLLDGTTMRKQFNKVQVTTSNLAPKKRK